MRLFTTLLFALSGALATVAGQVPGPGTEGSRPSANEGSTDTLYWRLTGAWHLTVCMLSPKDNEHNLFAPGARALHCIADTLTLALSAGPPARYSTCGPCLVGRVPWIPKPGPGHTDRGRVELYREKSDQLTVIIGPAGGGDDGSLWTTGVTTEGNLSGVLWQQGYVTMPVGVLYLRRVP